MCVDMLASCCNTTGTMSLGLNPTQLTMRRGLPLAMNELYYIDKAPYPPVSFEMYGVTICDLPQYPSILLYFCIHTCTEMRFILCKSCKAGPRQGQAEQLSKSKKKFHRVQRINLISVKEKSNAIKMWNWQKPLP